MYVAKVIGRACAASAILCCLAGCATTPPETLPPPLDKDVSVNWIAEHVQGEITESWWTDFGDASLTTIIVEAITNNRDVKSAAARIETARAEARIAGATLYPQIGTRFSSSRSRQVARSPLSGATHSSTVGSNSFGVSLDISWELDIWGRLRSGISAAMNDVEAQDAEYAAAVLSLTAQTAKAWFAVTEAQLQLDLANETVESYRRTAVQAGNRVDAGLQSPIDKHLTTANLSAAEALCQQRRETLKRSVRQLEILLGRYPAGKIGNLGTLPQLPPLPAAGLPSELLARRPDLIAAERRLAALDKRVHAARAALLPRLSLTSDMSTASNELKNVLNGNFLGWTIAGNLVQPILEGGRLRAQVDAAKGRFNEAAEHYVQQAFIAFGEVETALEAEAYLSLLEEAQQRTATAAVQAARMAENRYGQGVDTLLSLLEGQRRTLDARSGVLSAHRQRLDNRVDLYLALGGGFHSLNATKTENSL